MKTKQKILKQRSTELQALRELYFDAYKRTNSKRFINGYYEAFHKEINIRWKIFYGFRNIIEQGILK